LTLRIQDSAINGNIEGYTRALGSNSVNFFKLDPNVSAYECGLVVTQKPNEFEKEKLARRIDLAIQSNQITLADAMMIENVENVKYAEVLLGHKIKKNLEEADKRSMMQQQMNAQVQQQSAMVAEQAKQQTIQMESQAKMQAIQLEKELDAQLITTKLQLEAQIEQMKVEGKINMSQIEASSREYIAQIKKADQKK
jgi:hypothetical protein